MFATASDVTARWTVAEFQCRGSTGQTGRVALVGLHRPGGSSLQPSDVSGCCHRLRA
uniref:Polyketide synthase n=1 Tax=Peronospora matthiolae TaxID=2874970 RepID=A0AAV1TJH4_9STRA